MSVPSWVKDSIFYQIFPDRFYNGDVTNDPANLVEWNSKPTIYSFHGGDLRGIIDRFYYLIDMGINAIYLNPIFLSASNHRYNTTDYFQIDPKLGNLQNFKSLLDVAHRNQVRVVIDGVFNHCGRGFFAFNDILENQANSAYIDWFHIKKFPVDAYSPGDATTYLGWWKYKSLPKFNTDNEKVREYILNVARFWLEQGIDGWRLDVPNEIDDDRFWATFREIVKKTNPEAYLLGEIWDGDNRWVGDTHFDGLMNYPVRTLILDLLTEKQNANKFMFGIHSWLNHFPFENSYAMYNLLGSHDVERLFSLIYKSVEKMKLAFLILFTIAGAPAIYYGDEIGMEGGADPDNRRTFSWIETDWNIEIFQYVKNMIRIRSEKAALRRGSFEVLQVSDDNIFAFVRKEDSDVAFIVGNASGQSAKAMLDLSIYLPTGVHRLRNVLGNEVFEELHGGILTLNLNRWTGMILAPD
ncbi:MAG: glycoside hydrolase family 13 protein [Anaerolineaceae bacterium]